MIKTLTLKNFRKHTDTKLDFGQGLNVLRGSNEAGKSTVIEGVLYALYGAKALRNPLAETVTWGRKETELAVSLVINVEGKDYTFTRAKSGAECNYDGGKVTGQAEVTAFAAELLGADARTASLLMLASQNGLRGALDDGPTAVSGLMSKLADFDLIDRIIEAAQGKLLLGPEAPLRDQLKTAQADLERLRSLAPSDETWKSLDTVINGLKVNLQTMTDLMEKEVAPALDKANAELYEATQHNLKAHTLKNAIAELTQRIEEQTKRLDVARQKAVRVDPQKISAAETALKQGLDHKKIVKAYESVKALPAFPEQFWDGPVSGLEIEIDRLNDEDMRVSKEEAAANNEITYLRRQIIKGGKCPTCGHDAGNDEHVKQRNAEIECQIQAAMSKATAAAKEHAEIAATLKVLKQIQKLGAQFATVAKEVTVNDYPVTVDHSTVPCRIVWHGDAPVAPDLKKLETVRSELVAADNAAIQAEGMVEVYSDDIARFSKELTGKQRELAEFKEIPTDDLARRYNEAAAAKVALDEKILDLKETLVARTQQRKEEHMKWQHSQEMIATLTQRVLEGERDLKKLAFNNNLLKKLRTLKPAITDHLWNSVLAAVGNFFSTLRGEKSVVTKDTSGFKVNGQSIESLSGSTLDVLALAIRVALTKTFIPHASFVVLDEPAHGCDTTRTGNVLGFLASVGFAQTILASHDELSEAVADNVILLGA